MCLIPFSSTSATPTLGIDPEATTPLSDDARQMTEKIGSQPA